MHATEGEILFFPGLLWIGNSKSTLGRVVVLSGIIDATIAAQADDWNPTGLDGASNIRITLTGAQTITGIAGGEAGRLLILHNVDTVDTLTLQHDDGATSTAAMRLELANASEPLRPAARIRHAGVRRHNAALACDRRLRRGQRA